MSEAPAGPGEARPTLGAWVAGILAFVPAAVTLLVEVVAIRLLAPRIGSSLETYTATIGVVLAGLALGAWLGGRAADAYGPRPLIAPILLVSAALVALVAPAVDLAVAVLEPPPGPIGATMLAVAGLLLPSIVLAAATPVAARGTIVSREHSGSAVGRISAIATGGALVGTFVTGFVLLPLFPVSALLLGAAVALVLTAILLQVALGAPGGPGPTALLAIAALGSMAFGASAGPGCDPPSAYYCIRVGSSEAAPRVRDLVLDDLLHGSIDLDAPAELRFRYLRAMDAVVDAAVAPPMALTALHVGGGAFALPRHFAAERPGATARVLELDPAIVRLNRERLDLTLTEPALTIRIGDARSGLRDEPAGRYDLVIADVFAARAVPWHLVTREAMGEIRRTMQPGAIYVANVIDGGQLRLLGSYVETLGSVFPDVAVVWLVIPGGVSGNVVVVAGDDLPLEAIAASVARDPAEPARLATEAELAGIAQDAVLLTDDYAPTDALISR